MAGPARGLRLPRVPGRFASYSRARLWVEIGCPGPSWAQAHRGLMRSVDASGGAVGSGGGERSSTSLLGRSAGSGCTEPIWRCVGSERSKQGHFGVFGASVDRWIAEMAPGCRCKQCFARVRADTKCGDRSCAYGRLRAFVSLTCTISGPTTASRANIADLRVSDAAPSSAGHYAAGALTTPARSPQRRSRTRRIAARPAVRTSQRSAGKPHADSVDPSLSSRCIRWRGGQLRNGRSSRRRWVLRVTSRGVV